MNFHINFNPTNHYFTMFMNIMNIPQNHHKHALLGSLFCIMQITKMSHLGPSGPVPWECPLKFRLDGSFGRV